MRLPHQLTENIGLIVNSPEELFSGLGEDCAAEEADEIKRLFSVGLPPITSLGALAVMTGYNPAFLWSMMDRSHKHYRVFEIPKGSAKRQIEAPRVALKLIQKWLSIHFERKWVPHDAVHGFVKGRSHITAAHAHLGAEWVMSVDIENFFPSTSIGEVRRTLNRLGYQTEASLSALCKLLCYRGRLSQGAPSSPVISNIALHPVDEVIFALSEIYGAKFTRYADDVVLSGKGSAPKELLDEVERSFVGSQWTLSGRKRFLAQLPQRLKVHGLLVHGGQLRLTKGYRNQIRAYKYLQAKGVIKDDDSRRITGHLNYACQIDRAIVDK